jgi:glutathione peroxidase
MVKLSVFVWFLIFESISARLSSLFHRKQSSSSAAQKTLYEFAVKDIRGSEMDMNQFRDKVVLVVNVASKCGFTSSNYAQLKEFDSKYYERGLRILMFPCNQFGNQEPGDSDTVCQYIGGISERFLVTEKVDVNGSKAHPVFEWLKSACPGFLFDAVKWNFTKVLISY